MTAEERDILTSTLVLWTGFNASVFTKMTDRELLQEYERRVGTV